MINQLFVVGKTDISMLLLKNSLLVDIDDLCSPGNEMPFRGYSIDMDPSDRRNLPYYIAVYKLFVSKREDRLVIRSSLFSTSVASSYTQTPIIKNTMVYAKMIARYFSENFSHLS